MKLPRRRFLHLTAGAAACPLRRASRELKTIRHGRFASSSDFRQGGRWILRLD